MRDALLIVNRAAGSGPRLRLVEGVRTRLAAGGYRVVAVPTAGPGDATRLARGAVDDGAAAVFALGGDGTLREAAAGLLGSDVPLGPLPGGTTNVLTLALGLPRRPLAAAEVLARSTARPFDVGLCDGRPFLMMVSAGLDAAVVADLHAPGAARSKRWLGRPGIVARGLGSWWRYDYPELTLELRGERHRARFAALSNIPLYGGPFRMAPEARPDDRRLDLVLFHGTGRAATLGFARDLLRGTHLRRADVETHSVDAGEEVTVAGPPEAFLQVDGDPCAGRPPVTLTLAAERLAVLAP